MGLIDPECIQASDAFIFLVDIYVLNWLIALSLEIPHNWNITNLSGYFSEFILPSGASL